MALLFRCDVCGFELFEPIAVLRVSTLGLYDDSRYPGRCLLALHRHEEDFAEMPRDLAVELLDDARAAARAIKAAVDADRINYAVLGNAEPHVHLHLIPRKWETDVVPGKAPWAHPQKASPLAPEQKSRIVAEIARLLNGA